MKTVRFGTTGMEVSPLGFGAAPVGYLGTDASRIQKILDGLLDSGVNVIDTAECYPGSEEAIGRAVASRRGEYVLVTKCGHKEGLAGSEWSGPLISESVNRSLKRLRTDRLDVVLLHSCDLATLKRGEALAALVAARDAGKIRFIGYSGDNEEAVHAAGLADVSVLETSVSICDQASIDKVLPVARKRGLGVLAKRPIANAAWRRASEQQGIYADYARTYSERLEAMRIQPADLGFPGDSRDAWPEVALRFTLSQPGVSTAIVGTTDPSRLASNLAAVAKGPLPPAAIEKLRAAFRAAEEASGQGWPGQT